MRCYKMLQYVRRDCQRLCRRLEQSRWVLHPVILAPGTPEMLGFVESMGQWGRPWPCSALPFGSLWYQYVNNCQYVSIEAPWSSHHHQGAAASQRELFRLSPFLEHVRPVDHLYKTVSSWCSSWNATCRRTLWTHGSPTAVQLGISGSRCVDWCHRFHVSSDETQSWQFRFKSNCMYANVNGLLESLHAIR